MLEVFQPILLIFQQFLTIFSEIFHHTLLGRIYLSRCVYLALYGRDKGGSQGRTDWTTELVLKST